MSNLNINEDAQSAGEFSASQSSSEVAGESQNITDSAFPDEDEDTITMLDVIQGEEDLEEEASAVLGNSDEKNCTYPKGYIPRQALYSCATCSVDPNNLAAICLACSLECHDNHEVYELYTKRNYRCDCGNSKFKPDFQCKLVDKLKKSPENDKNKYNHNFSGRYCTCDKRFPPDENDNSAESQDEMWQCIVCEDWYHSKHLGARSLPAKFDELICSQCVNYLDFVHYYKNLNLLDESATATDPPKECPPVKPTTTTNACESDTNDSQAENKDPVSTSPRDSRHDLCILEKLKSLSSSQQPPDSSSSSVNAGDDNKGPLFWPDCNWRAKLCRCQTCMAMYKMKECEYLLDDKDTVQYYEAQGKLMAKDNQSPMERGMSALNRMNRAAVVEALHGYDEMKADLSDYLRKFADSKKIVRAEDIQEFFQQFKSKKRPRLEYE